MTDLIDFGPRPVKQVVSCYRIDYPPPPKGWKGDGYYYVKTELGEAVIDEEFFMEGITAKAKELFPQANRIRIRDYGKPPDDWWMSGTL